MCIGAQMILTGLHKTCFFSLLLMEKATYLGAFPVISNWNDSKISFQSLFFF